LAAIYEKGLYFVQLARILTSGGHVFDQELALRLLEVPFRIF